MGKHDATFSKTFVKALNSLDNPSKRIAEKRMKKILDAPLLLKPLRGEAFVFSERFLGYRIIYKVEGNTIKFLKLGKRDSIYRD
ncbi:hypothetical protein COT57_00790 [Candidatus Micrarchaeota archaeon CG09_land_8_20_14_0_10_55_25]|nr:MAG: hypothetical protein AUJ15_00710 [Candidatus Micrarchaeota archaeon CG1_02_55_41]PIO03307.1 MAG: hypothetical protein COT57_00790 [Candidatus Micrarchaeota archaeon CG09_land_8_20_14_0_10_55_25]